MIEAYPVRPPVRFSGINSEELVSLRAQMIPPECGSLAMPHEWEVRQRFTAGGAKVYQQQCVRCGWGGSRVARVNVPSNGASHPFDESRNKVYRDMRQVLWMAYNERVKRLEYERAKEWWDWYNSYLTSDVWRRKRQAVMRRSGGICEACLSSPATEVHHLRYDHVGSEPLFDLVAICHDCHTSITPEAA